MDVRYISIFILIKVILLAALCYYAYQSQKAVDAMDLATLKKHQSTVEYLTYTLAGVYTLCLVLHLRASSEPMSDLMTSMHSVEVINIAAILVLLACVYKQHKVITTATIADMQTLQANLHFNNSLIYYIAGFNLIGGGVIFVTHQDTLLGSFSTNRGSRRYSKTLA